jgi:hypothetical protein
MARPAEVDTVNEPRPSACDPQRAKQLAEALRRYRSLREMRQAVPRPDEDEFEYRRRTGKRLFFARDPHADAHRA